MNTQEALTQVLTSQRNQAFDMVANLNAQLLVLSGQNDDLKKSLASMQADSKWEHACLNVLTPEDYDRVRKVVEGQGNELSA